MELNSGRVDDLRRERPAVEPADPALVVLGEERASQPPRGGPAGRATRAQAGDDARARVHQRAAAVLVPEAERVSQLVHRREVAQPPAPAAADDVHPERRDVDARIPGPGSARHALAARPPGATAAGVAEDHPCLRARRDLEPHGQPRPVPELHRSTHGLRVARRFAGHVDRRLRPALADELVGVRVRRCRQGDEGERGKDRRTHRGPAYAVKLAAPLSLASLRRPDGDLAGGPLVHVARVVRDRDRGRLQLLASSQEAEGLARA